MAERARYRGFRCRLKILTNYYIIFSFSIYTNFDSTPPLVRIELPLKLARSGVVPIYPLFQEYTISLSQFFRNGKLLNMSCSNYLPDRQVCQSPSRGLSTLSGRHGKFCSFVWPSTVFVRKSRYIYTCRGY
jgi:hypothetical protein